MNIMANAIDSIDGAGSITIRTKKANGTFQISIEDTGAGISPNIRDRIFEPFFTTKPVGLGTGLGLAISYGIVQAHHGAIDVESEVGKGTIFTVKIPLDLESRGLSEQGGGKRPAAGSGRLDLVGARGFEPPASSSQKLRPDSFWLNSAIV